MNYSQPAAAQDPLDWDALSGRCLGRADLMDRVLLRFQGTLQEELERLEQAFAATDAAQVAQIAHRIKGMSLTVSANGLAHIAQHLENRTRGHEWSPDLCLADLRREISSLIEHIANRPTGKHP